ncbi:MAG TPA: PAS domain S-box protein [archaeon]|nr:PAS domain S-box protein [archaeon]
MKKKENLKLQALTDISAIDITMEFDQILDNILKITCETMSAHSGTIMQLDEVTEELTIVASHNLGPDYIEKVYAAAKNTGVNLNSSPSGVVLKTGKYYVSPNLFEDTISKPWYELGIEKGISAQIFTPMKRGMKVTGLLNIYMGEPHEFTDEEINFVTIAASQAASVVQNARICSQLKNNVNELNEYKKHLEEKITETYKELYNSENYLKTIITSSIDGITVLDEHGNFEFANDSFFNIIEWPSDEITGKNFEKLLPEYMKEVAFREWGEVQKGPSEFEISIITQTGKIKHVNIAHSITEIKGSKKVVSVVKDITKHKKLIMELEESEAKYKELFDNAQEGICTVDTQGRFIAINNSGLKIYNCEKEEIMGTYFSDWLAPDCSEIANDNFKHLQDGRSIEKPVIREIILKNGTHRWIVLKVRLIYNGNEVTGIHGMFNDITEKKNLELKLRYYNEKLRMSFEKLKKAEIKYRELFEMASDAIYSHDAEGNIQTINKSGLEMLNCTKEAIIGTHFSKWLTSQSIEIASELINNFIAQTPATQPKTLEIISKGGHHLFGELKATPIYNGKELVSVHGIIRNVTEKITMEQKLAAYHAQLKTSYEELMVAQKQKTEFISNISYELLNPLTPIRGFTELILDEKIGQINDIQKNSLETIIRNSDRLTRLVKNLLSISILESNEFIMEFRPINVNEIISKSIRDFELQANKKNIRIIKECQPDITIKGDELGLLQVLTNLLDNAIKFSPHNGDIRVVAEDYDNEIRLSIIDSGVSIPSNDIAKILERFHQTIVLSSIKFGGVGLGLDICKMIVEKFNGTMNASSDEKGSTFQIILPKKY